MLLFIDMLYMLVRCASPSMLEVGAVDFMLLLFAFQSMFISIWFSRFEIAEFPTASAGLLHKSDDVIVVRWAGKTKR